MRQPNRGRLDPAVAAALAVAGVMVLAVGLAALYEQRRALEAGDLARHTIRVLHQISRVTQLVTEAETGQRGYLITGDRQYLRPYERALTLLPTSLHRLRKLTADNPSQRLRLEAVEPLVAAKVEELRLTLSQIDRGEGDAIQDLIRSGLGKDLMQRIRLYMDGAAKEERFLLRERLASRTAKASNTTWLILGGSVLSLALMSLAAAVLTALLRRARTAEHRSRESEERLRVTLRSIGDAVIATDTQGRIVFMNPVAEALTAWREADGRGQPLDEVFRVVNADTRRTVESPAARVLRDGVVVGLANHTVLMARDGREIQIDDSGAPIRDADGELMGVVLVFRDVSEREAADVERRRALWAEAAQVEAERANEAKDAFLAVLSHELRSPLSAMLAWVSILGTRGDDPVMRERAVAVLERGVRTQTQLINDLLDVSRIVSGKLRVERAPVDLAAALPETLDSLQPAAEAKGVTLVRDLCGGPLVVLGDEARLEQVVRNLVENSIKFTPAGGRVTVRMTRAGGEAVLGVEDTGEGFPPEVRAAIFDRFHQSPTPRTRRHGGLGLGLAIVRHLIDEHGGTVSADSPGPGQGATFAVRMPLADDQGAVRPATARPGDVATDLHGVPILVVEDDPDWREAVALRLTQEGAQVTAVGSVAEALAALETQPPRILVSDIGMPEADGYELIRRVRAMPGASLHAIAMTGFADPESRERCLRLGFDDFLAKPFEPGELVATIGAVVGS